MPPGPSAGSAHSHPHSLDQLQSLSLLQPVAYLHPPASLPTMPSAPSVFAPPSSTSAAHPVGSALGPQQQARLGDLLETVRKEFELVAGDAGGWKRERDDMESKIALQIQETALIRQNLYDLEAQHVKVRQDYEAEIAHLRRELEQVRLTSPITSVQQSQQQRSELKQAPPSQPLPVLPSSNAPGAGGMHSPRRDGRPGGFMSGPLGGAPPSSAGKKDLGQLPALGGVSNGAGGGGGGVSLPPIQAGGGASPIHHGPSSTLTPAATPSANRPTSSHSQRTTPIPEQQQQPLPSIISPIPKSSPPVATTSTSTAAAASGATPNPSTPQPFASNPPPPPSRSQPAPAAAHSGTTHSQQPLQTVISSDIDPESAKGDLKKSGDDWVAFWSPAGVATGVNGKAGKAIDVGLVHTLPHESIVCCVKFSHDGKWLATGCNRTVQIYDAATGQKSCVLQDESTAPQGDLYIRTICFSPDGRFLATGAEDRQIRIWDISKRAIRHLLQGHSQEIYSLDFSSDGRHLVSGSGDQSARIWDIESGTCTFDLKVEDLVMGADGGPVDAGLTSVAVSPDGKLVAAGSLDAVVRLWDAHTGVQLGRFVGHSNSVYSVAFSPDGSMLCSGSLDCSIRVWDLSTSPPARSPGAKVDSLPNGEAGSGFGSCQTILKGHKDYVLSVGVTNDGRWVVSGSKDRGVQFYDTKSKAVQLLLQGHKNSVISIDLSKNSGLLATGSGDLNARIWSYTSPA